MRQELLPLFHYCPLSFCKKIKEKSVQTFLCVGESPFFRFTLNHLSDLFVEAMYSEDCQLLIFGRESSVFRTFLNIVNQAAERGGGLSRHLGTAELIVCVSL